MTTSSTPLARKLTAAYVAMLAERTGRPFGDLDAPGAIDQPREKPYGLVQRLAAPPRFGDVARPAGMAIVVFKVTCVGVRVDQADWLADGVLEATLGFDDLGFANPIVVDGHTVIGRELDGDDGTSVEGAVVNSGYRFAFTVTTP